MSEALLYSKAGISQRLPGGFGREYPKDYKLITDALAAEGALVPGEHVPALDKCEYCGYALHISNGWVGTFKDNVCGIPAGTSIAIGGDCLRHLMPVVELKPNWGRASTTLAKKRASTRLRAIEDIRKIQEAIEGDGYWRCRAQAHCDTLCRAIREGWDVSTVARYIDNYAHDLERCTVACVVVDHIPVPVGYAKLCEKAKSMHDILLRNYPEQMPYFHALFASRTNKHGKAVADTKVTSEHIRMIPTSIASDHFMKTAAMRVGL